jgi:septal ring factor EnvC (AmiA/AmiB activator)
VEGYK